MSFSLSPYLAKTCLSIPSSLLYCDLPGVLPTLSHCISQTNMHRNESKKLYQKLFAKALVDQFGENIEKLVVLLLGDFWHTRDKNGGREAIVQLHRSLNARQGVVRGVSQKVSLIPTLKSCLNQKTNVKRHKFSSTTCCLHYIVPPGNREVHHHRRTRNPTVPARGRGATFPDVGELLWRNSVAIPRLLLFFLLFQFLGNLSMTW